METKHFLIALILAAWFVCTQTACGQPSQSNSASSADNAQEAELRTNGFTDYDPIVRPYAYYSSAAVWPFSPERGEKPIYVCWENPKDSSDADKQVVLQALIDTWQANSQLRFRGWQQCAPNNRGIRIQIADTGPHVKYLGRFLDGATDGMVLNFTFGKWSPSCAESESKRRYCIYSIAVHEFGHAIGQVHEQNRWDAPGECQELRQGSNGDVFLTPYDPDSALNYCNEKYNNDGRLSDFDVKAVRLVYGDPL